MLVVRYLVERLCSALFSLVRWGDAVQVRDLIRLHVQHFKLVLSSGIRQNIYYEYRIHIQFDRTVAQSSEVSSTRLNREVELWVSKVCKELWGVVYYTIYQYSMLASLKDCSCILVLYSNAKKCWKVFRRTAIRMEMGVCSISDARDRSYSLS